MSLTNGVLNNLFWCLNQNQVISNEKALQWLLHNRVKVWTNFNFCSDALVKIELLHTLKLVSWFAGHSLLSEMLIRRLDSKLGLSGATTNKPIFHSAKGSVHTWVYTFAFHGLACFTIQCACCYVRYLKWILIPILKVHFWWVWGDISESCSAK